MAEASLVQRLHPEARGVVVHTPQAHDDGSGAGDLKGTAQAEHALAGMDLPEPRKNPWVARCRIRRPATARTTAPSVASRPLSTVTLSRGAPDASAEGKMRATSWTSAREPGRSPNFSSSMLRHPERSAVAPTAFEGERS